MTGTDDAEGGDGQVDVAQAAGRLELAERVADELEVGAHALVDLPAHRRGQRPDFVGQVRDRAVGARDDQGVTGDELAEALLRVPQGLGRPHDLVADLVETEADDLEEQRFLAADVVIQAGLRHPERARNVVDRSGVVPALEHDLRRGPADFGAP